MLEYVNVLLSTYNGEKYLSELLESIANQSYPYVKITIRDDGSSDNTLTIIKHFIQSRDNVEFIKGKNMGVIKSFFTLLKKAESDKCNYFAFCDQDDVWFPDKLERAINAINSYPKNKPIMYCSAYRLVDENLNNISVSPKYKKPDFCNALVENIATGCTIVINKSARNLIVKKLPQSALMHDWWIYLVVSAFGEVIVDPVPSILYRQHSSNVVGVKAGLINKWVDRMRQYRNRNGKRLIHQQVSEFYELYRCDMDNKKLEITEKFLNERFINRINNVFWSPFYRQSAIDNFIFKVLYLNKKI